MESKHTPALIDTPETFAALINAMAPEVAFGAMVDDDMWTVKEARATEGR